MEDKSKHSKRGWRFWKHNCCPTPTRDELQRHLDLAYPGPGREQDKLKLIILRVLLEGGLDEEQVIILASRRNISAAKAKEFLRGDVEFGFRQDVLEALLLDVGGYPVSVELAMDLFAEFSRTDHPKIRATHDPGHPAATATPPAPGQSNDAKDPSDPALRIPRPRNGDDGESSGAEGSDTPRSRPDPRNTETLEQFIAAMFEFRLVKGERSFRKMAKAVNYRYAHTTFAGLRTRPKRPRLELVQAFLIGCGAEPDELTEWEEAWRRIALADSTGEEQRGADPHDPD